MFRLALKAPRPGPGSHTRPRATNALVLALAGAALLAPAGSAMAQDSGSQAPPTSRGSQGPCPCRIGGHRFLFSDRFSDPFVASQVHTTTGGGLALGFEDLVELPARDSVYDALLKGDLGFVSLGFNYQQRIFRRFAVGIGVVGSARVGIDGESILAQGVTSGFTTRLWAKGLIIDGERQQLTAGVRFLPTTVVAVDPVGWAEQVLEDGEVTDENDLVKTGESSQGTLGLSYAYAWRPWLGFLLGAQAGLQDPFNADDGARGTRWRADGGASLDLYELNGWPLGFFLGYRYSQLADGASDIVDRSTEGLFGVYFTGTERFSVGVELLNSSSRLTTTDATLDANVVSLDLRYFF